MSRSVVPEAVLEAIDDVSAILEAKYEAGEEDHATDPDLDEAVERFSLALDLHCPTSGSTSTASVGRGRSPSTSRSGGRPVER